MVWLFLVGLAIWTLVIQIRLSDAENQLRALRRRQFDAPLPPAKPSAASPRRLPSELVEPAQATAVTASPGIIPRPPPTSLTPPNPTTPAAAKQPTRPPPAPSGASTWISEKGLAWLGGGALALGGCLLVAYAAQQGLFTPALRIWAGIALAIGMFAAGEWIRRQTQAPRGRHGLAAAMASGAGATTLYASIWAAYALYGFLTVAPAAALLASVSLGLLGLALLHGEALALLAIVGAFAAPIVCSLPNWNGIALDAYLALIVITGLAITAARDWDRAGLLSLVVAGLWTLSRCLSSDLQGAAGLLVATPAITLIAVMWAPPARTPGKLFGLANLPLISLVIASVLWAILTLLAENQGLAQALVGTAIILLTTAAVRQDLVRPRFLGAPALALILIAVERTRLAGLGEGAGVTPWLLTPMVTVAASGFFLVLTGKRRTEAGVIAAAAAAFSLTLLRGPIAAETPGLDSLVFLAAGAMFFIGATFIARRSEGSDADLALAAWVGAGAETLGLAIHTSLGGQPEPLAYGTLGLGLALAARRLAWRGLPEAAALAALISLLSLLGPQTAGAALSGQLTWTRLALVGAAGVLAQAATWWVLRPRASAPAEAALTSAIVGALLTMFLVLRLWAMPSGAFPAALDGFTEAALRTLLLLATGYILCLRAGSGPLSRLRGPVFLALGVLHGAVLGIVILNPWWGAAQRFGKIALVGGPPVLDELALGYLAPALLLFAADRRLAAAPARTALTFSAAGFLWIWAIMEIRRLFHGPALAAGGFTYAEVAAYAVAFLALALAGSLAASSRRGPVSAGISGADRGSRWIALIVSTWLVCLIASPWWGPLTGAFHTPVLLAGLICGAIALTALLARYGAPAAEAVFGHSAYVAVILQLFVLLTLSIRFGFHGAAMRTPLREASVETWTYSAAWALYGLLILATGARGGDRVLRWLGLAVMLGTTAKVFLFDMATLQGVVRAASFLALGALLLIGALAARRLGSGARAARSDAAEVKAGN